MISAELGAQLEGFVAKIIEAGRARPAEEAFDRLEAKLHSSADEEDHRKRHMEQALRR